MKDNQRRTEDNLTPVFDTASFYEAAKAMRGFREDILKKLDSNHRVVLAVMQRVAANQNIPLDKFRGFVEEAEKLEGQLL